MIDDSIILAVTVFFGIFIMFFFLSLLADLLIVLLTLGGATAAYFIPEWYPIFYNIVIDTELIRLGLVSPENLDIDSKRMMAVLIIIAATILAIPVLPFSGTYRQILGANRIGRKDEAYINSLIAKQIQKSNKTQTTS